MAVEEKPSSDVPASWLETLLEMRQRRIRAIEKIQQLRHSVVFVFWNLDDPPFAHF